ncbi:MAG: tail fiber domain-containing protein [Paracoccaceae bacterium]
MKRLAIAALLSAAAAAGSLANAGSAIYVPPVPTEVETPMRNGSGAWLIPLAIIAILALTLTGEDDEIAVSDARLKTGISPAGTAPNGLPLYTYRYIGGNQAYLGVMAQDVLMHSPQAIVAGPFGYMAVDYGMLGMEMQPLD